MTLEGAPRPEARAPAGLRLRQSLRADRQALSLGREPHPHDGGGAALHLGRDLQDHQHAERRHGRGLQERLPALLAARAEGQRALPRRLEALAAAQLAAPRRRGGRGRGGDRRDRRQPARRRAGARSSPSGSSSASSSGRCASARSCRTAARATRRRRSSAATRCISAPANTTTAASARSSSTCTRKAPPSASLMNNFAIADLARPAIRRAARGIRRGLHLHALRAGRHRPGQRHDQERHLDPRLHLPRARHLLSRPPRPRPRQPRGHRRHRDRRAASPRASRRPRRPSATASSAASAWRWSTEAPAMLRSPAGEPAPPPLIPAQACPRPRSGAGTQARYPGARRAARLGHRHAGGGPSPQSATRSARSPPALAPPRYLSRPGISGPASPSRPAAQRPGRRRPRLQAGRHPSQGRRR